MNKNILARNFSRCAAVYDKYSNIQRLAASELMKELPDSNFEHILEIGCGTGSYTQLLRERFKHASIKAVDIAEKMVDVARQKLKNCKVEFSVEDAEDMDLESGYDLITSNAAIQWFELPGKAIEAYKGGLKDNGALTFSVFGPLTFKELEGALEKALTGDDLSVASRGFLSKETLEKMLARFLKTISIKEMLVKEEYPSLAKLLENIKYTGVRGSCFAPASGERFVWSRSLLKKTEDAYEKECGRIVATYQIFLCKTLK